MNFLEYSNKTQSNIIPQEEFEELIHEVFNTISENLCKSLGPLGSSATILDGMMTDATKDGYSILRKYCFHNRYKKMIYNLIMAPCTRMNNTVGDGTTTAIALTNALFDRYKAQKNSLDTLYRLPRQFTYAWDSVVEELCERIQEKAIPVDPEDYDTIYNIAYVTSNGNKEISENIARVYKEVKSPSIKQKDSPTNKSYIEAIDGYDFPANLISDAFIRNQDLSAKESNIAVIIFDHKIESDFFTSVIMPINEVMRAYGKKLLVLAPYYDAYMCDTLFEQYITMEMRQYGKINLIAGQFSLSKVDKTQLADLAVILKAKVINQDLANGLVEEFKSNSDRVVDNILKDETYKFYRLIGTADEAMLTCQNGSIFKNLDISEDIKYQETVTSAEKELQNIIDATDYEKQIFGEKIFNAKTRVMRLKMKSYIYYIGADSALQKNIIWDAVEDVIKCVRSAIKYGVVPGCQLSIESACIDMIKGIAGNKTSEEIKALSESDRLKIDIIYLISSAVADVYSLVLHGPEGMGMVKLINGWQNTSTQEEIKELHKAAIEKAENIVKESIKQNKVFDMETLDYNDKIITSAETDRMVLSAASDLIKILISGNQCVFLDADVNGSHQETVEAYV